MADVAVENKETPVVEKVAEEVDAGKKEVAAETPATEEATTTENGEATAAEEKKPSEEAAKENGSEPVLLGSFCSAFLLFSSCSLTVFCRGCFFSSGSFSINFF